MAAWTSIVGRCILVDRIEGRQRIGNMQLGIRARGVISTNFRKIIQYFLMDQKRDREKQEEEKARNTAMRYTLSSWRDLISFASRGCGRSCGLWNRRDRKFLPDPREALEREAMREESETRCFFRYDTPQQRGEKTSIPRRPPLFERIQTSNQKRSSWPGVEFECNGSNRARKKPLFEISRSESGEKCRMGG